MAHAITVAIPTELADHPDQLVALRAARRRQGERQRRTERVLLYVPYADFFQYQAGVGWLVGRA